MSGRDYVVAFDGPRTHGGLVDGDIGIPWRAKRSLRTNFCLRAFPPGNSLTGAQRMRTVPFTLLLLLPWASAALAHGTESHGNEATWTFDPWIVVPLLAVGLPYFFGLS